MKHISITINGTDYKLTPSGSKFDLSKMGISGTNKPTEASLGYHMSLSTCIDKIAKDNIGEQDEVLSLKQYVERYEASLNEVKELLNEFEF